MALDLQLDTHFKIIDLTYASDPKST